MDWAANPDHKVCLCLNCQLEAFQARRLEPGDYELDEVSAFRGSIMQGIGLTKHGRYPRKLTDELGIPKKKTFENNQHGVSKAFAELSIPSGRDTLLIEHNDTIRT